MHETNSKRQRRATEFVFSRQPQQAEFLAPQSSQSTNELPKANSSPSLTSRPSQAATQLDHKGREHTSSNDSNDPEALLKARRFHISRNPTHAAPKSAVVGGRVEKRNTVFVERMPPNSRPNSRPTSSHGSKTKLRVAPQSEPAPASEQARPQKKPGLASRTPLNRLIDAPALLPPAREVRLSSGEVKPWDEASEKLAAELQAYTLQEIGHKNRASRIADEMTPQSSPQRKAIKSRFTPKVPTLRYRDRHPEEQHVEMDQDKPMVYDDEMEDDSEYVIDTYIRIPAHEIGVDTAKNFGLLVLDSQPDIDEFYREDSDHEEDENDDEEDENGMLLYVDFGLC